MLKIIRHGLYTVANTNGRDVICSKCSEHFENLYVLDDFSDEEFNRFVVLGPNLDDPYGPCNRIAYLSGCPACRGGTTWI